MNWNGILVKENILVGAISQVFKKYKGNRNHEDYVIRLVSWAYQGVIEASKRLEAINCILRQSVETRNYSSQHVKNFWASKGAEKLRVSQRILLGKEKCSVEGWTCSTDRISIGTSRVWCRGNGMQRLNGISVSTASVSWISDSLEYSAPAK